MITDSLWPPHSVQQHINFYMYEHIRTRKHMFKRVRQLPLSRTPLALDSLRLIFTVWVTTVANASICHHEKSEEIKREMEDWRFISAGRMLAKEAWSPLFDSQHRELGLVAWCRQQSGCNRSSWEVEAGRLGESVKERKDEREAYRSGLAPFEPRATLRT